MRLTDPRPVAIAACLLALAGTPAVADPRDLVLVEVSDRSELVASDLPVIWKGASFFLAEWDEADQAVARHANLEFEILAPRVDADREIFIVESFEPGVEPPIGERARVLHRSGRKWVVALESGETPEWDGRAFSFFRVPRQPRGWNPRAPTVAYGCDHDPLIDDLIQQTDPASWTDWIEKLSGAEPIVVAGVERTVLTRYSPDLFDGTPSAKAYDYALEQLAGWHFAGRLEEHAYDVGNETWKNLVVTIPGTTLPDEIVLLTAHLDSINAFNPAVAPGANDNGTGVATLLEAARVLRQLRFRRTIRIVWFTGEEQLLLGSEAFVADYPVDDYLGVINLDMFGWDGDGDRCFEIHAGTKPDSIDVGNCFAESIESYEMGLARDLLTVGATDRSDHASFWQVDVGAIAVAENFFDDNLPGGCVGQDANPGYHTIDDTVAANLVPSFGFDIARVGLATIAAMAIPVERCFASTPILTATPGVGEVDLGWEALAGAASYRIQRSIEGCAGQWVEIGETSGTSWTDSAADLPTAHYYRVEAVDADGFCVSAPSECTAATPTVHHATGTPAGWIDVCATGGPGSADGTIDPGESVLIPVSLLNDGNASLENVDGILSVFHPGIQIIDPYAGWPDLLPAGSASTEPNHFGIQVAGNTRCATSAMATVSVTHDQGSNPTTFPIPIAPPLSTLLLDEDFQDGIPGNWTVIDGGSGGGAAATWTTDNPGGRSIPAPFVPPFAIVDSAVAGSGATQDEMLITPSIDAAACSAVDLEFTNQFRWWIGGQNEIADVDLSTDGGIEWINVLRMQGDHDGYGLPVTKSIDITAAVAANPSDVTLRFHYYQAGSDWWWAVDNIEVRCTTPACTPCSGTVGPPGEPGTSGSLRLSRQSGQIVFEWDPPGASCQPGDYAVYRGDLTQLITNGYGHDAALVCATGDSTFSIAESDAVLGAADYFLVVADNGIQEGSYGRDGGGVERPASASACHVAQNLTSCE